ncbi:MAG: efflux RND transporter permease subunit [bacterium]|nr:efflux RND transporter permease subunit [bacterium]
MSHPFFRFIMEHRPIVIMLTVLLVLGGLIFAPFEYGLDLPRNPVPVDAIPDIGENQQIVFTEWPGRSPRDIEDQITYPLTTALTGLADVKTVRSFSMLGFSSVYVIFNDNADFYDSRSRLLEKLASLPAGMLPDNVRPTLGPDATALGQVFWYTLEGRNNEGNPAAGWSLDDLRSIQDWHLKYALQSVPGVSEVASVGGYVREYQVEVNPDALRFHNITLQQVVNAVRKANVETGARTMEINRVEYLVRGIGFVEGTSDIASSVIKVTDNIPITVADVANVITGPAQRRGLLDKGGSEAVGGVVVVRYGANPMQVIESVKSKIESIALSLPEITLEDGTVSKVTVVPFYDRSGLIQETLDTLHHALSGEILVTLLVVLVMVGRLRGSILIAGMLPLAVLFCFVAMKIFGVDANIVALSGIAIAIGTMVDMAIVLTENITRRLDEADSDSCRRDTIANAAREVAGAVVTAVATTIVSFLPVFTLIASEGKLFRPLAWTKTFALGGALLVSLALIPVVANIFWSRKWTPIGMKLPAQLKKLVVPVLVVLVVIVLAMWWQPLGKLVMFPLNLLFTVVLVGGLLLFFKLIHKLYVPVLRWCLDHKTLFLILPLIAVISGGVIWSGLGREFMPPLDEGSFLYMPTTMPHAGVEESSDVLSKIDMAIASVPEVDEVVGKIGRVESALDPAPLSMVETVVTYHPEYGVDEDGNSVRQWREHIHTPDDIWDEIVKAAQLPGTTSAPKLQPIATRIVMLQSGMRAPMGVRVQSATIEDAETAALAIEAALRKVDVINPATVAADRIVGKPYLEVEIDRDAAARYGLTVHDIHETLAIAVGGKKVSTTVEGRERYNITVRLQRERRDSIDELLRLSVPFSGGFIPLQQVAHVEYRKGPQMIRSEDTLPTAYVVFGGGKGLSESEVVATAEEYLRTSDLDLPTGTSYKFTGSFENRLRAEKTLKLVLPIVLIVIFMILHLQFKSVTTSAMIFAGVFVAWSGGFILLWLYGQSWFLAWFNLQALFQVHPVNMSVAVWVGFIALFGIATDDGVLMATYLRQVFADKKPGSKAEIRAAVIEGASRRVRPALMTTATTMIALLPIMTSTGRGSDIMVPMAIPSFGGMGMAILTILTVPVIWCAVEEARLHRKS